MPTNRDREEAGARGHRAVIEQMAADGELPSLLADPDGEPVGWCALGPRERDARMRSARSRVFRPSPVAYRGASTALPSPTDGAARDRPPHCARRPSNTPGITERIDAYPEETAPTGTTNPGIPAGSLQTFLDAGIRRDLQDERPPDGEIAALIPDTSALTEYDGGENRFDIHSALLPLLCRPLGKEGQGGPGPGGH